MATPITPDTLERGVESGILTAELVPNRVRNPERICGYLRLWIGPMFAGKSSRLMTELTTYADVDLRVLYINHSDDTRSGCGDNMFSTHSSQYKGLSAKIMAIKCSNLLDISVDDYDVIGIDEAQFFTDLVSAVDGWINEHHKIVLCAGLDGDSQRKPIDDTLQLIPLADKVTKLSAVCHKCLMMSMQERMEPNYVPHTPKVNKAPFTVCLVSGSGGKKVGGIETYSSMCRYHYNLHVNTHREN